ncbi:glycosyltransferase [Candidatus Uhrbacteria bacterium]|nr:glycosyltransferase [Candidatus Uhrbacteria bacterium]
MHWIVLPARNESAIIADTLVELRAALTTHTPDDWHIIVADNGSADGTRDIVRAFTAENAHITLLELATPGKGHAVIAGWNSVAAPAAADVFVFMDADLATDCCHLPELVAAIRNGADIAIGSRYLPQSQANRSALRHAISHMNRWLLARRFGLRVSDPPCGFKAVNARVIRELLPHVRDRQWFFDTELLIRATHADFRIVEIPVAWREPRGGDSPRKLWRMMRANRTAMRALAREMLETRP